jgi:hypothetical protein
MALWRRAQEHAAESARKRREDRRREERRRDERRRDERRRDERRKEKNAKRRTAAAYVDALEYQSESQADTSWDHPKPDAATASLNEQERLRSRWQEAQERTREQSKRAEEVNRKAAEERLRKVQGNTRHEEQSDESAQAENERKQRLAAKRRAAEERERKVLDEARARQTRAAEDMLRSQSSKRKRSTTSDDDNTNTAPKRETPQPTYRLKKLLAREWSRRKHDERLTAVGGIGFEHLLRDELIDLRWEHVDRLGQCDFCYLKKNAKVYGMWRCPDGGAMACRACLNGLSTYGT